jgi:DNA-binding NtrC family response regulator
MRSLTEYSWPGNVRELENMVKRLVVLQDEQFIVQELARLAAERQAEPPVEVAPAPVAAAPAAPVAAPAAPPVAAPAPVAANGSPVGGDHSDEDEGGGDDDAVPAASGDGVNLHELAKAAAMEAEREAINLALTRFRWNRRKTAAYLKVSYKTLLNKMKECGIRGADLA